MLRLRFLLAFSSLTVAASLAWPTQAVTLHRGDIIVSNSDSRSIMRVDPVTGAVTDIARAGGLGNLRGLVIESDNSILVANQRSGSLLPMGILRIDPETGSASPVTSPGDHFTTGISLRGIVLAPWGNLLVGGLNMGGIVEVDLQTGLESIFSSTTVIGDMEFDATGNLLITTGDAVVKIDPQTKQESTLSSFAGDRFPLGLETTADGRVFVTSCNPGCSQAALEEIDTTTGARTPLVPFGFMREPHDIEFDLDGDLLIVGLLDLTLGQGMLRFDFESSSLTTVTSSLTLDEFQLPNYLEVVLIPEPSTALLLASGLAALAVRRRSHARWQPA